MHSNKARILYLEGDVLNKSEKLMKTNKYATDQDAKVT